ncbi:MAG TPA: hypothetical protein VLQ80_14895, partial [Candidatus Saccharimonadia bacterium]|nr:hypothetical protein [Candidatus Saccharimonadia bacterium]
GLRTMTYLDEKERAQSPEASTLAALLRGLKPFKAFLTIFVRNTRCLNEVMRMVKTQGLSAASIQACQERLSDLPASALSILKIRVPSIGPISETGKNQGGFPWKKSILFA